MDFFGDIIGEVIFQILFLVFAVKAFTTAKKKAKADDDGFKVSSVLLWDADFLLLLLFGAGIFIFIFFDALTGDAAFQIMILLFTLLMYVRRRKSIIDDADDVRMPATLWNSDALLWLMLVISSLAAASSFFTLDVLFDDPQDVAIARFYLGDWQPLLGIFCYIVFRENSTRQIRFDSQHRWNIGKIWNGELSLEYLVCIGLAAVYCMFMLCAFAYFTLMPFLDYETDLNSFVEVFTSEFELYASLVLFALPSTLILFMIIVFVGIWRSAKASKIGGLWPLGAKIATLGFMAYIGSNIYSFSQIPWFD